MLSSEALLPSKGFGASGGQVCPTEPSVALGLRVLGCAAWLDKRDSALRAGVCAQVRCLVSVRGVDSGLAFHCDLHAAPPASGDRAMHADRSGVLSVGSVGPLPQGAGEGKEANQVLGALPGEQAPSAPQLSGTAALNGNCPRLPKPVGEHSSWEAGV